MVSHLVSPERLATFPVQHIAIASGGSETIPLRVYAVRDPSLVVITPRAGRSPEPGFQHVRLVFHLSTALREGSSPTAPVELRSATRPVFAFLLTIGLPPEKEDAFYETVVRDFLTQSWMSLPRLLKEMGCADPTDLINSHGEKCD